MRKRRFILTTSIIIALSIIYTLGSAKQNRSSYTKRVNNNASINSAIKPDSTTNKKGSWTTNNSVFIPHWATSDSLNTISPPIIPNQQVLITQYIYFGISPKGFGINKADPGYINLSMFHNKIRGKSQIKTLLTLRMTNQEQALDILDNKNRQQSIISETIQILKQEGFDGIILDLELSALPTENLQNNIVNFVSFFADKVHYENLTFSMTLYGDVFYRARPYNVSQLSKNIDYFYIMLYDLHKPYGNPGPNFPLVGKDIFGYDLKLLGRRLITMLPSNKLIFIFGLYGYDWTVDKALRSTKPARALTLNQIRTKKNTCLAPACIIVRDKKSAESKISYTDDERDHIVWFEDEQSISKKIDYLNTLEVAGYSFWAWGYY